MLILGVVGWWNLREKVTNKRFQEAEKRLAGLESDIKHPPSCTYHSSLEIRIENMRAGVEAQIKSVHGNTMEIKGRLEGISCVADLMNEFLINQGGKR
jgi:hypothetical protein